MNGSRRKAKVARTTGMAENTNRLDFNGRFIEATKITTILKA